MSITDSWTGALALDEPELDSELQHLLQWGAVSRNLRCCILPSGTEWMRLGFDVWIPTGANGERVCADWFIRTVVAAGDALPIQYMQVVESMVGKKTLAELVLLFARESVFPEVISETVGGNEAEATKIG